jgi:hypothetical protein
MNFELNEYTLYDVCDYDDYIRDYERVYNTDERHIGSVLYPDENGIFLLDLQIDVRLFYKFDYSLVSEFSQLPIHPQHIQFGQIEIVQIKIVDDAYTVIIKTFWIRIIQRAWKRYVKEHNEWLQNIKKNVLNIINRTKKIPREPSCRGILSNLFKCH